MVNVGLYSNNMFIGKYLSIYRYKNTMYIKFMLRKTDQYIYTPFLKSF